MKNTDIGYALSSLTKDVYAYVHKTGTWGRNNAGLICDGDRASLLVDTLFTVKLTRQMIDEMRRATVAANHIDILVNTHANGDHCFGNELFKAVEIVASEAAASEMTKVTPPIMNKLLKVARLSNAIGPLRHPLAKLLGGLGSSILSPLVSAAPFLLEIFGDFDFNGIETAGPNRTFSGALTVSIGKKQVELIEVGSAHTRGDVMAFVPEDGVLFAGDLLFIGGHPLMWEGPVHHWIEACDKMLSLKAKHVVPGHGPLTDSQGIQQNKDYLTLVAEQAKKSFDAGDSLEAASDNIHLGPFATWSEPERLIVNLETLYREFSNAPARASVVPCFELMANYRKKSAR